MSRLSVGVTNPCFLLWYFQSQSPSSAHMQRCNDGQLFSCWVVLRGFTPSFFPGSSIAFEYMLAEMEKEIPFRLKLGVLRCPCCLCVSHCWGFLMQGVTSSHSTTRNSSKGSHVTILTKTTILVTFENTSTIPSTFANAWKLKFRF